MNAITTCMRCRIARNAPACRGPCPCPVDRRDISAHAQAGYCPERQFGDGAEPVGWADVPEVADARSRGLGDTVARLAAAVGIEPCGGCEKRRAKLNELFPYTED